jgi:hypothetical protein
MGYGHSEARLNLQCSHFTSCLTNFLLASGDHSVEIKSRGLVQAFVK